MIKFNLRKKRQLDKYAVMNGRFLYEHKTETDYCYLGK